MLLAPFGPRPTLAAALILLRPRFAAATLGALRRNPFLAALWPRCRGPLAVLRRHLDGAALRLLPRQGFSSGLRLGRRLAWWLLPDACRGSRLWLLPIRDVLPALRLPDAL